MVHGGKHQNNLDLSAGGVADTTGYGWAIARDSW